MRAVVLKDGELEINNSLVKYRLGRLHTSMFGALRLFRGVVRVTYNIQNLGQ